MRHKIRYRRCFAKSFATLLAVALLFSAMGFSAMAEDLGAEDIPDGNYEEKLNDGAALKTLQRNADTVAAIGGQQYSSLKEAIDAVPAGGTATIEIVKDIPLTASLSVEKKHITLTSKESCTITFSGLGTNENCLRVGTWNSTAASLTISGELIITTTDDSLRSIVNVVQGGSLSMQGGKLISGSANLSKAIVCVDNGGNMTMTGGVIQGSEGCNSRGVMLQDTSDPSMPMSFTMSGGTITDCATNGTGSGVYIGGAANFTMSGGEIKNCSSGTGGYVYTNSEATFNKNGGTVEDIDREVVAKIGNTEYHSLQEAINAVFQNQETATEIKIVNDIAVTEAISVDKRNILLTADGKYTITFSLPDDSAGSSNGIKVSKNSKLVIDGENLTITTTNSALRSLVNVAEAGSYFELKNGMLDSDSADIGKAIVCLDNDAAFTMSGGTIQGQEGKQSRGVVLQSYGGSGVVFKMSGGKISGCHVYDGNGASSANGGGVLVAGTVSASFEMSAGTIENCSAAGNGGGVAIGGSGRFTMSGGTITGCTTDANGGGVRVDSTSADADFNMTGGEITNCEATYSGGGVSVSQGVPFVMGSKTRAAGEKEPKISGCEAGKDGGGVHSNDNTEFTMQSGEISNCTAADQGGGVCLRDNAKFTMESGAISECKALQGGGIMALEKTEIILNNGSISKCEAKKGEDDSCGRKGGGIYLGSKDTKFTMKNGTISDNTAEFVGGGIYTESGGTIYGGTITGNKTDCEVGFGGGIYVHKEATLQLYNTVITENTATSMGGGVWACRTGDIRIYVNDGGAVYGNEALPGDGISEEPERNPGAGDDLAWFAKWPGLDLSANNSIVTLYARMLGGALNHYYQDGSVVIFSKEGHGHDHGEGLGLGAPGKDGKRYDKDSYAVPYIYTENEKDSVSLKNVVSSEAAEAAMEIAENTGVVIAGNQASRGGGIGTNGNLVIGAASGETYSVTVKKEWADTPENGQREVNVYLNITKDGQTEQLGPVTLSEENGWEATFSGLTEAPSGTDVTYTVVEDPVPEGFEVSDSMEIDKEGNATFTITNTYTPPEEPEDPDEPDEPDEPGKPDEPDDPDTPDSSKDVVKTGDETNLILWMALAGFSALAMISILVRHRLEYKGKHDKSKAE